MTPDFELIAIFKRHKVPFVVIGGHAVNFHGYRRATEDVDLVWKRSADADQKLLDALAELQAAQISNEIDPQTGLEKLVPVSAQFIASRHLMMLWTKFGFLDLFDYVPSFPEQDVNEIFATSLEENGVRYISLEWLRKLKSASGRTKDLLDLEKLEGM